MLKKEKGITLIALIITIVVLLILAGITITGSIQGVDKANDNKLMTDLQQVHHAIRERETKYKLTKDESLLVGTKIDITSLTDVPSEIKWKVVQFDDVDNPEREYYRISGTELVQLGLTSDPTTKISYIINYYTGEVYNETDKKTSENKVLYVTSEPSEVSKMGDEIIKDGLLVWYDAINNTGNGHSSTTTVWKDLSGNGNDATLYGFDGTATSGWNSNYLAFDGQNDWVLRRNTTVDNEKGTIEVVCKHIDGSGIIFRASTNNEYLGRVYILSVNTMMGNPGVSKYFNNSSNNYRKIASRVLKYYNKDNESYFVNYYNMNKTSQSSFQNAAFEFGKYITLGSIQGNYYSSGAHMNLYSVRVYNRDLSDEEIHHNYLIDKARFGIEE